MPQWQTAVAALMTVVDAEGPSMLARIAMTWALNVGKPEPPEPAGSGRRLTRSSGKPGSAAEHFTEPTGEMWHRLAFRDYLRAHPEEDKAYERLKRRLATEHRTDREAYTEAKSAFRKCCAKGNQVRDVCCWARSCRSRMSAVRSHRGLTGHRRQAAKSTLMTHNRLWPFT
jgi:hypothetical protein